MERGEINKGRALAQSDRCICTTSPQLGLSFSLSLSLSLCSQAVPRDRCVQTYTRITLRMQTARHGKQWAQVEHQWRWWRRPRGNKALPLAGKRLALSPVPNPIKNVDGGEGPGEDPAIVLDEVKSSDHPQQMSTGRGGREVDQLQKLCAPCRCVFRHVLQSQTPMTRGACALSM